MEIKIVADKLVYSRSIQSLCLRPFYNHPHGCPNFGKKKGCPPFIPLIDKLIDLTKEIFVIYSIFPVGQFAERMRISHPQWQNHPRQWYNPRRWQPTARKQHREEVDFFRKNHSQLVILDSPEANGVNVSHLMKQLGIELNWQWPPKHSLNNLTYLVSIAGYPIEH